jgi:VanZ family protein
MKARLPEILCGAVLGGILTLGLWPFHAPQNDVSWLADTNGLHFGRFGTVFSSGEFLAPPGKNSSFGSLEVWLQPGRIWDFGTFLAFYTPECPFRFSLHQWQTGLLLQAGQNLQIDNAFPRTGPAFLTITEGRHGAVIYVDGAVVKMAPEFRLFADAFTGRLVLGDSPGQSDSWSGRLRGLAIYYRQLTPDEVLEHFLAWTRRKGIDISTDEGDVALYLFDERAGRVVHSRGVRGVDLYIPQKYLVLNQIFLESPWSEYRRTQGFWSAVVKNIIGFIPLGFCFYAYFSLIRQNRRAMLTTVTLGFAVSLTVEVLQAFLPTRDSGVMDLLTNTLGTYIGALSYRAVHQIVVTIIAMW